MLNFLKGVLVGIGGVAPGLSGSVLLVIFGLYQKVIDAIATIFRDFKKNMAFLVPVGAGVVLGVLLFSKIVDFLLGSFEMQTRYAFLGLIVGTIPLFWREVHKHGFSSICYAVIAAAAALGVYLVYFATSGAAVTNPTVVQSVLMGVAYAGSAIIPGVDSAAIMSALGLYVLWVESLATLNLAVLVPAAAGLFCGLALFSALMHLLLSRLYTLTFSVVFGLFLSIIPSVLRAESGAFILPSNPAEGLLAVAIAAAGFAVAYAMGRLEERQDAEKDAAAEKDEAPRA